MSNHGCRSSQVSHLRRAWACRKLAFITCFSISCCTLAAQTPVFDAAELHGPTDLAYGWLVHAGDDPSYARPDFDDSHWIPFRPQIDDLHNLFAHKPEVVWYRLHLNVAPRETGLALLLESNTLDNGAFEVYSNGVKLIKVGDVTPYVHYDLSGGALVSIPDKQSETGSLLVAVRLHVDALEWKWPHPGLGTGTFTLGQESSLHEHRWYSIFGANAIQWLDILVNLYMLLGAFVLYSTQRNRPEYFWMFVWLLAGVPSEVLGVISSLHPFPARWHILEEINGLLWPLLVARMYCALVGHRIGWKLNIYAVFCGVLLGTAGLGHYIVPVSPFQIGLANIPLGLLTIVILPQIILRHTRSGNRAEAMLILPILLNGLTSFGDAVCLVLTSVPPISAWAWRTASLFSGITAGPFSIPYNSASDLLSLLSLALIILIRSNRMSRQQAFIETEMASAREIQQVILPKAIQSIPGFRIESVYEPAREVGGDFFQLLPVGKDSALVVIGDVAGKGLPAAMLVSLLVGTTRTCAEENATPEFVLSKMNKQLMGRTNGGFSTALAALFESNGAVTIANAGHLAPYLNGHEVELPAALPLGIVEDVKYEMSRFCIEPGSRMTFYSDGIVEAQDEQGALLGFDRARELSMQSASEIAQAAKSFGQEDDITVVVIERLAENETSTAEKVVRTLEPV